MRLSPNYKETFWRRGLDAKNGDARSGRTPNYPRAIEFYNLAIVLDANYAEALAARCWARAVSGQLQAANADCTRSQDLFEKGPDSEKNVDAVRMYRAINFDSMGFILLRQNRLKEAAEKYSAALRLDNKNWKSYYGLWKASGEARYAALAQENASGRSFDDLKKEFESIYLGQK